MSEERFARQVEVVWRLAPDRVLVRRPWPEPDQDEAADLLGVAALIWVALDEPGTADDVIDRIGEALDETPPADDVAATLTSLLESGWVVEAADATD